MGTVAIVGLRYAELPTTLALLGRSSRITGFDVSDDRLRAIETGDAGLSDLDRLRLSATNGAASFRLTSDSAALTHSDAVIICIPTPVDEHGVGYKAGVSDVRESPALPIIDALAERGADVHYHDSLVPVLRTPQGRLMRSVTAPSGADWELAVIHVVHPRTDNNCAGNDWIASCPRVLDVTYQFNGATQCSAV